MSTITQEDLFSTAIEVFGIENQMFKAIEECGELISALSKHLQNNNSGKAVIDEIADVFIMANQLRLIFGEEEVDDRIKYKLERLLEMMGRV